MGTKSSSARQAALTERRVAAGWRRIPVWLEARDIDLLRRRFPGPRGGIDWKAVIKQATS